MYFKAAAAAVSWHRRGATASIAMIAPIKMGRCQLYSTFRQSALQKKISFRAVFKEQRPLTGIQIHSLLVEGQGEAIWPLPSSTAAFHFLPVVFQMIACPPVTWFHWLQQEHGRSKIHTHTHTLLGKKWNFTAEKQSLGPSPIYFCLFVLFSFLAYCILTSLCTDPILL